MQCRRPMASSRPRKPHSSRRHPALPPSPLHASLRFRSRTFATGGWSRGRRAPPRGRPESWAGRPRGAADTRELQVWGGAPSRTRADPRGRGALEEPPTRAALRCVQWRSLRNPAVKGGIPYPLSRWVTPRRSLPEPVSLFLLKGLEHTLAWHAGGPQSVASCYHHHRHSADVNCMPTKCQTLWTEK